MKQTEKLSDVAVKKAKPSATAYRMPDGLGLFLFVTPAGGKLWRWKYRFGGHEKLMALGSYPDVSLAEARKRLSAARKQLDSGHDPMAKRKEAREARHQEDESRMQADQNSFQNVALLWHKHWKNGKTERHTDYVRRRMDADVFPALGARPIGAIEAPELVRMIKGIESREALDVARRALQNVDQVFRYAIAHGLATRNPAKEIRPADVLRPAETANHARVEAKELPQLLKAIEGYQGTNLTRLAMKLMAITFVRTSELIGAKWSEIDFDNARWNIPAERMKMRTPHIVPLSRQAVELLEDLRPFEGEHGWLFPGNSGGRKSMSNNTILKSLERMGYKGRMTGHGFRGLASTILHEQGFPHEHIEIQLAHIPRNDVSAAYNHALYLDPRAKMMQAWADFLERTQRTGKVLPFRTGAA